MTNLNLSPRLAGWLPARRIKTTQRIFLVQQLQIMVRAGVPMTSALHTLEVQASSTRLKRILASITTDIERGKTLAEGMTPFQREFGELMISMIAAGETSGRLEDVLGQIYLQMKKDHEIVSKVRGALIYPAVVVTAMLVVGIGVVVYIIPKLTTVFVDANVELPLPTKILVATSNFLVNQGIFAAIGVFVSILVFGAIIRHPRGRLIWHSLLLALPIVGSIIRKVNTARFARTVSSFLKTDIPIVKTLVTTAHVLGNVHYQRALVEASERIAKGLTLHEVLADYPKLFNPTILQMIAVGEQSGALDDILAEAANFYENEVSQTMSTLPSLLEPVLMIVLGIGVGGMAVAIMMPLYSLTQAF